MNLHQEVGPIFIFASGQRCGSTLLQRFLCSNEDIMIWGEHDGILETMFDKFDRLDEWQSLFGHMFSIFVTEGVNNFIPNMNPPKPVIKKAQVNLLENLWRDPAHAMNRSIWGFKEVLYTADMAIRLKELFPTAKVIYLTRNLYSCFISLIHEENFGIARPYLPREEVWTRERTKEFIRKWTDVNRSFHETPGLLDEDWIFSLTYEQLTGNTKETTEALIEWLGLDVKDFSYETFKYKLYTDRPDELKNGDQRPKLTPADLSPEDLALVTTEEILEISAKIGFNMNIEPVIR